MFDLSAKKIYRTDELPSIRLGEVVSVNGWVEDQRPLGSLLFMTLRDRWGIAQIVFNRSSAEVFRVASNVPRQSYVSVGGRIQKSKAKNLQVEVHADSIEVLNKASHPLPLDPTGRIESSLDIRLDARALDLRNPKVSAIFKIKSGFLKFAREYLESKGFLEVNTPKIIGAAAEGGAELFSLDYFGKQAYLAQSPQLYKEQLTLSLGRVYEIASYFRAEKMHTVRHLNEFLSLDIEAADQSKEDVMEILEDMVKQSHSILKSRYLEEFEKIGIEPSLYNSKFEMITYSTALREISEQGKEVNFGDDLDSEALRLLSSKHKGYYFIVDWPASIKPFYIRPSRKHEMLSESFDLMFGALELASGGERVAERTVLEKQLTSKGLGLESFSEHLKVYDWGMPPHSGWGFGVDRFIMSITARNNIREAVLYPRDSERIAP